MTRTDAIANAHRHFASGEFLRTLERRVAYKTESQNAGRAVPRTVATTIGGVL